MWRSLVFVFVCVLQYVSGLRQICENKTELSCTTEILGPNHTNYDYCKMKVYPSNSKDCGDMSFGPLSPNGYIGGVTLQPYTMHTISYNTSFNPKYINQTVLNITFSNIKWKTMKFRFNDRYKGNRNHCRSIMISKDIPIDDKSVLYYDCYWTKTDDRDGQTHILDFEATDEDNNVNRGQYYFNIPSADMLDPTTTEEKWKPFIYIEIFPSVMRLHVMPPPQQLKINAYHIKVLKDAKDTWPVKSTTINLKNNTEEAIYDYYYVGANGSYSFVVIPLHDKCGKDGTGCQKVQSPGIKISSHPTLNICIASITALIVASLFAYYIALRLIRRYWCNDKYRLAMGMDIPTPPKILVVYSPANRLHADCVASLVNYLRCEYGFDVMFDGDISSTPHGDPYIWAQEALAIATHIMYIVGPAEESNLYNNIYDKPIISAHKDVDALILSLLKSTSQKEVLNVFFEYSNGQVPIETKHTKLKFTLLKEWQKLISYLSKNLLPKKQIMRTEKGRCFNEDLTRAKKLLNGKNDDVIMQCEKTKNFEKKILL